MDVKAGVDVKDLVSLFINPRIGFGGACAVAVYKLHSQDLILSIGTFFTALFFTWILEKVWVFTCCIARAISTCWNKWRRARIAKRAIAEWGIKADVVQHYLVGVLLLSGKPLEVDYDVQYHPGFKKLVHIGALYRIPSGDYIANQKFQPIIQCEKSDDMKWFLDTIAGNLPEMGVMLGNWSAVLAAVIKRDAEALRARVK